MPSRLNPYLVFDSNAREAMEFYKSVFGGDLRLSTFSEIPGVPHDPSEDDKIMHGVLEASNGIVLMGADTPKSMEYRPGKNVSMSLGGADEAELRGYFEKLSAGGTIHEPLARAPWGDTFGMFADKFGIEWMVNIEGPKKPTV